MKGSIPDTNRKGDRRSVSPHSGEHRASASQTACNGADLHARATERAVAVRSGSDAAGRVVGLFVVTGGRRAPTAAQTDAVLGAFLTTDRLSLRRLKLLTDLPHELVVGCVERRAADGLLAVESRPDGNDSRGIASLTEEGRRRSAGGVGEAG